MSWCSCCRMAREDARHGISTLRSPERARLSRTLQSRQVQFAEMLQTVGKCIGLTYVV